MSALSLRRIEIWKKSYEQGGFTVIFSINLLAQSAIPFEDQKPVKGKEDSRLNEFERGHNLNLLQRRCVDRIVLSQNQAVHSAGCAVLFVDHTNVAN